MLFNFKLLAAATATLASGVTAAPAALSSGAADSTNVDSVTSTFVSATIDGVHNLNVLADNYNSTTANATAVTDALNSIGKDITTVMKLANQAANASDQTVSPEFRSQILLPFISLVDNGIQALEAANASGQYPISESEYSEAFNSLLDTAKSYGAVSTQVNLTKRTFFWSGSSGSLDPTDCLSAIGGIASDLTSSGNNVIVGGNGTIGYACVEALLCSLESCCQFCLKLCESCSGWALSIIKAICGPCIEACCSCCECLCEALASCSSPCSTIVLQCCAAISDCLADISSICGSINVSTNKLDSKNAVLRQKLYVQSPDISYRTTLSSNGTVVSGALHPNVTTSPFELFRFSSLFHKRGWLRFGLAHKVFFGKRDTVETRAILSAEDGSEFMKRAQSFAAAYGGDLPDVGSSAGVLSSSLQSAFSQIAQDVYSGNVSAESITETACSASNLAGLGANALANQIRQNGASSNVNQTIAAYCLGKSLHLVSDLATRMNLTCTGSTTLKSSLPNLDSAIGNMTHYDQASSNSCSFLGLSQLAVAGLTKSARGVNAEEEIAAAVPVVQTVTEQGPIKTYTLPIVTLATIGPLSTPIVTTINEGTQTIVYSQVYSEPSEASSESSSSSSSTELIESATETTPQSTSQEVATSSIFSVESSSTSEVSSSSASSSIAGPTSSAGADTDSTHSDDNNVYSNSALAEEGLSTATFTYPFTRPPPVAEAAMAVEKRSEDEEVEIGKRCLTCWQKAFSEMEAAQSEQRAAKTTAVDEPSSVAVPAYTSDDLNTGVPTYVSDLESIFPPEPTESSATRPYTFSATTVSGVVITHIVYSDCSCTETDLSKVATLLKSSSSASVSASTTTSVPSAVTATNSRPYVVSTVTVSGVVTSHTVYEDCSCTETDINKLSTILASSSSSTLSLISATATTVSSATYSASSPSTSVTSTSVLGSSELSAASSAPTSTASTSVFSSSTSKFSSSSSGSGASTAVTSTSAASSSTSKASVPSLASGASTSVATTPVSGFSTQKSSSSSSASGSSSLVYSSSATASSVSHTTTDSAASRTTSVETAALGSSRPYSLSVVTISGTTTTHTVFHDCSCTETDLAKVSSTIATSSPLTTPLTRTLTSTSEGAAGPVTVIITVTAGSSGDVTETLPCTDSVSTATTASVKTITYSGPSGDVTTTVPCSDTKTQIETETAVNTGSIETSSSTVTSPAPGASASSAISSVVSLYTSTLQSISSASTAPAVTSCTTCTVPAQTTYTTTTQVVSKTVTTVVTIVSTSTSVAGQFTSTITLGATPTTLTLTATVTEQVSQCIPYPFSYTTTTVSIPKPTEKDGKIEIVFEDTCLETIADILSSEVTGCVGKDWQVQIVEQIPDCLKGLLSCSIISGPILGCLNGGQSIVGGLFDLGSAFVNLGASKICGFSASGDVSINTSLISSLVSSLGSHSVSSGVTKTWGFEWGTTVNFGFGFPTSLSTITKAPSQTVNTLGVSSYLASLSTASPAAFTSLLDWLGEDQDTPAFMIVSGITDGIDLLTGGKLGTTVDEDPETVKYGSDGSAISGSSNGTAAAAASALLNDPNIDLSSLLAAASVSIPSASKTVDTGAVSQYLASVSVASPAAYSSFLDYLGEDQDTPAFAVVSGITGGIDLLTGGKLGTTVDDDPDTVHYGSDGSSHNAASASSTSSSSGIASLLSGGKGASSSVSDILSGLGKLTGGGSQKRGTPVLAARASPDPEATEGVLGDLSENESTPAFGVVSLITDGIDFLTNGDLGTTVDSDPQTVQYGNSGSSSSGSSSSGSSGSSGGLGSILGSLGGILRRGEPSKTVTLAARASVDPEATEGVLGDLSENESTPAFGIVSLITDGIDFLTSGNLGTTVDSDPQTVQYGSSGSSGSDSSSSGSSGSSGGLGSILGSLGGILRRDEPSKTVNLAARASVDPEATEGVLGDLSENESTPAFGIVSLITDGIDFLTSGNLGTTVDSDPQTVQYGSSGSGSSSSGSSSSSGGLGGLGSLLGSVLGGGSRKRSEKRMLMISPDLEQAAAVTSSISIPSTTVSVNYASDLSDIIASLPTPTPIRGELQERTTYDGNFAAEANGRPPTPRRESIERAAVAEESPVEGASVQSASPSSEAEISSSSISSSSSGSSSSSDPISESGTIQAGGGVASPGPVVVSSSVSESSQDTTQGGLTSIISSIGGIVGSVSSNGTDPGSSVAGVTNGVGNVISSVGKTVGNTLNGIIGGA